MSKDNLFIVVDCQGFSVPSRYTHLALNWREIYRLFEEIIIGELVVIFYDPDYNSDCHYKVSVMGRGHRGTYRRFSARYLTLDDAVHAALESKP